jgi:hypothetical protein
MQKENFDDLSQRVGVALSVTKAFEDDMEQVVTFTSCPTWFTIIPIF